MFVIDCIVPFLKKLSISEEELKTMKFMPNNKKSFRLIEVPEVMCPEEIVVSE